MTADTVKAPLLEARGIATTFGRVTALSDATFSVHAGAVSALAGADGAGKSTFMKILSGAFVADGGELVLDGKPIRLTSPQSAPDHGNECAVIGPG